MTDLPILKIIRYGKTDIKTSVALSPINNGNVINRLDSSAATSCAAQPNAKNIITFFIHFLYL